MEPAGMQALAARVLRLGEINRTIGDTSRTGSSVNAVCQDTTRPVSAPPIALARSTPPYIFVTSAQPLQSGAKRFAQNFLANFVASVFGLDPRAPYP
jgi:hypothetical protein